MARKRVKKGITFSKAKEMVKRKVGVLDMERMREGRHELILFYGPRGGHRATYNKTTKEFWWTR